MLDERFFVSLHLPTVQKNPKIVQIYNPQNKLSLCLFCLVLCLLSFALGTALVSAAPGTADEVFKGEIADSQCAQWMPGTVYVIVSSIVVDSIPYRGILSEWSRRSAASRQGSRLRSAHWRVSLGHLCDARAFINQWPTCK